MKNNDLKDFYDRVYRKGEKKHYTKLLFSGESLSEEKMAILSELSWKGKEVLDLGCGTGELVLHIAKNGAKRVVGVDYAKSAIDIAKDKNSHENASFICGDVSNIKGKYAVITIVGVLEHIDDPLGLLMQAKRFLKPKGSIIVTCPNWSNVRGYILMTLKELFEARITLVDIHYFTPLIFEEWAKKLKMKLDWKTIEQDWGHGKKMIEDLKKRLAPVLKPMKPKVNQKAIDKFIKWVEINQGLFKEDNKASGAVGFYHFRNK